MANIFFLYNYNNYYNRIVKKPYHNIQAYLTNYENEVFYSLNFNPNDGLTTSHVINADFSESTPNYLLVENERTFRITRWFIVESVRLRIGQYRVSLKRDLLADYYEPVLNATSYINKGFVNALNPLIFNSENILVNQIKKAEVLIKDNTKVAWIVGYVAPNIGEEGDVNINVEYQQDVVPDISEFEYSEYVGKDIEGLMELEQSCFNVWEPTIIGNNYATIFFNGNAELKGLKFSRFSSLKVYNKDISQVVNYKYNFNNSIIYTLVENYVNNNDIFEILNLNNNIYKDGDVYKKVVVSKKEEAQSKVITVTMDKYPNVYNEIVRALEEQGLMLSSDTEAISGRIDTKLVYSKFKLELVVVDSPITQATATIKSTSKRLKDAPYKMFCLPYAENIDLLVNNERIKLDYNKCLQIASSLATGLKTGAEGLLYDIQLLPYCPIKEYFVNYEVAQDRTLSYLYGGVENIDYTLIKDNETTIGAIFWCPMSSFTTISKDEVWYNQNWSKLDINDPIGFKTNNETVMTRMVSPNYANNNSFNQFMNYGVNYIDIDCTYKPYTPYIKCNINYKGLYGKDFDDNRGLVLGGDFTLPAVNDKWIDYQIQNKNYSNIFDRETQHLEYSHKWGMASAVTGALGGAAIGGLVGNKLAGPGGAIAGAIGAGVTGLVDVIKQGVTFGENMDYRKDMYEFNLQNIRALPNGLIKSSSFNYNSRIFPFIEFYDCTDVEKEMVRNKIKYSGMTINTIGSIKDYLNPSDLTYIQGKIIKIDIHEDSLIANEINKEINMGVYYE